jgi:hypothetical protein
MTEIPERAIHPIIEGERSIRPLVARAAGAVVDRLTFRKTRFDIMVNICEDQILARTAHDDKRSFGNSGLDGYADDLALNDQERSDAYRVAEARIAARTEQR